MPLDIIDPKTLKPSSSFKEKIPTKNTCKISFGNKTIKKINLTHLIYDPLVKTLCPNSYVHFGTPSLVYTFMNPIGSKLFNFNKFVNNLETKAFLDDNPTVNIQALQL